MIISRQIIEQEGPKKPIMGQHIGEHILKQIKVDEQISKLILFEVR
jgi:hypothetical protein